MKRKKGKFHISPKTGKPARCRAVFRRCPYDELDEFHYDDLNTAEIRANEINETIDLILPVTKDFVEIPEDTLVKVEEKFSESFFDALLKEDEAGFSNNSDYFRRLFYSLPNEQQLSVNAYTLKHLASEINLYLRNKTPSSIFTEDEIKNHIENLDSAFENIKNAQNQPPGVLYRSVGVSNREVRERVLKKLANLTPGEIFKFSAFTSTSLKPSFTDGFSEAREKSLIFQIVSSGAYINESVEEVVLKRNEELIFIGYQYDEFDKIPIINLIGRKNYEQQT